jgi:hypothetical protein
MNVGRGFGRIKSKALHLNCNFLVSLSLLNLIPTDEVFMILKHPLSCIKEFFKDPTVRKAVFWIACLVAFSARFATG